MLVGEIGIRRHEFLYEIRFWEARRIIRGYNRRHVLHYQLQRIQAYYACFAMRENKGHLTPMQFLPMYFDSFDDDEDGGYEDVTEADVKRMREEMRRINEEYEKSHATD